VDQRPDIGDIGHAGRGEPVAPDAAGVARPAGAPSGVGLVAAHGFRQLHAQLARELNDFRFRKIHQRRAHLDPAPLDRRLGGEVRHRFEGAQILGPAVRITGIVDGVRADEDMPRAEHLGPAER
jgi:hypothetical protein